MPSVVWLHYLKVFCFSDWFQSIHGVSKQCHQWLQWRLGWWHQQRERLHEWLHQQGMYAAESRRSTYVTHPTGLCRQLFTPHIVISRNNIMRLYVPREWCPVSWCSVKFWYNYVTLWRYLLFTGDCKAMTGLEPNVYQSSCFQNQITAFWCRHMILNSDLILGLIFATLTTFSRNARNARIHLH